MQEGSADIKRHKVVTSEAPAGMWSRSDVYATLERETGKASFQPRFQGRQRAAVDDEWR